MGVWELLRSLLRHWPVVLVGAMVSVVAVYVVTRDRAVYFSRVEVAFLAPSSDRYPNSLQTKSADLIVTAGAVAKRVVGAEKPIKYGSTEPTIIGTAGATEGVWIRLPDSGGQWAPHFNEQVLLVDVVAASPERVHELTEEAVARIADELERLQLEVDTREVAKIQTQQVPDVPVVHRVGAQRARAAVAAAGLGVAATVVVVLLLDGRERRRTEETAGRISESV